MVLIYLIVYNILLMKNMYLLLIKLYTIHLVLAFNSILKYLLQPSFNYFLMLDYEAIILVVLFYFKLISLKLYFHYYLYSKIHFHFIFLVFNHFWLN